MTRPLVECVPNFSEGRDRATLRAIENAIAGVPGTMLLDMHADPSHNRSVFTFAAPPEAAADAAFHAVAVARDRIDLRRHRGVHPRIGATDVVPFVPLRQATLDDCIGVARALGERVAHELNIPVYLYARAATVPAHERLADLRRGGFEALAARMALDPAALPDFGPPHPHPTAGATAIGARPVLVAYNIWLDTPDVAQARAIARAIRTSSGGLPAVQAAGFAVAGRAQVSTNLLDVDVTTPQAVYRAVEAAAHARGLAVARVELVGLLPERAAPAPGDPALPDAAGRLLEPLVRAAERQDPD